MNRPSLEETFLSIASTLAKRSTCLRAAVGCVLVDLAGKILSVGYNGVIAGAVHCKPDSPNEQGIPCKGIALPAGQDSCKAVHAELNALMSCKNLADIHACYITHAPCRACTKALLATPCKYIIFLDSLTETLETKNLWIDTGRRWTCHS